MKHAIPRSALEHHIAFVGKTGSGKTGSAKSGIIEPALAAGERVCVIDPTGAWWGLRLDADGKSKGLPIYVFGGDHGDFPLLGTQGEMMAEAIGETSTPAILDTTRLKTTERMRFFTDFADTILRVNRGPLRLVIDEAHLFAPQAGTRGAGAMPDMLHAANNLISLGRSRGLRVVLISQRPAKVHKDSLTQVETLVAMRLIAPQDRKAVEEWIADQADKETGRDIIASLPTLKTGEAWVWSPEANFLNRVTFPLPKTYDSSKVQGTGKAAKRLSPIDVEKLQEKFAKVKTEAEAKDPKILQRRVADLEQQLRKAQASPAPAADPAAIAAAEQRSYARGLEAGLRQAGDFWAAASLDVRGAGQKVAELGNHLAGLARKGSWALPTKEKSDLQTGNRLPVGAPKREPAATPAPRKPSPASAGGDGNLSGPQREILASLAWWAAMGHDQPSKAQVAAVAGWKVKGSHLRNRLAELSSKGLVTYPRVGFIQLTPEGAAAAPSADTSQTLIERINAMLSGPQREVFEALLNQPEDSWTRQTLAEALGWDAGGSHLRNRLAELSSMEIVTYPSRGEVQLQGWVIQ